MLCGFKAAQKKNNNTNISPLLYLCMQKNIYFKDDNQNSLCVFPKDKKKRKSLNLYGLLDTA